MGTKKRSTWRIVGVVILGVAITRMVIAFGNASSLSDNSLGLTGMDALVLGAILALIAIAAGGAWVNKSSTRLLVAVRQQFADRPVYLTTVLPHLVEEVQQYGMAPKLKENTAAAVVFSAYECGWWCNPRKPVRVGAVTSDEAIGYSIGTTEHFGRPYQAIFASIKVNGTTHSIPIGVISETSRSFIPKWAVEDELRAVEAELHTT